ncbi:hypothetical protein ONZ45_g7130 [Pleurotus djamor]|nr:hypothetical protein ONZ45_g7130 [Pleurotus djamor]
MVATKYLSSLAAVLIVTPLLVVANPLPHIPRDLPNGTDRIAYDEKNHSLLAFDASGKMLGRVDPGVANPQKRAAGSCSNLSADDAQKLPGWKAIEDQANKNWGNGKRKIVTNDQDFANQPAQLCVGDGPVAVTKDGQPQCSTNQQSTEGKLAQDGSVTLDFSQGTDFSATHTVTKESTLGTSTKISVEISFEDFFEFGSEVTASASFSNTLSDSTTSSGSTMSKTSTTMKAPAGKQCHLDFKVKACTIQGKGSIPYVATGWVWFEYDSKVQDHYKWAVNIDQAIPKVEDRSSNIEFKSAVSSSTKSEYNGVCDK